MFAEMPLSIELHTLASKQDQASRYTYRKMTPCLHVIDMATHLSLDKIVDM